MDASRAATGMLDVFATKQVRFKIPTCARDDMITIEHYQRCKSIDETHLLAVHTRGQLREIRQHFRHLIPTLAAAHVDNALQQQSQA